MKQSGLPSACNSYWDSPCSIYQLESPITLCGQIPAENVLNYSLDPSYLGNQMHCLHGHLLRQLPSPGTAVAVPAASSDIHFDHMHSIILEGQASASQTHCHLETRHGLLTEIHAPQKQTAHLQISLGHNRMYSKYSSSTLWHLSVASSRSAWLYVSFPHTTCAFSLLPISSSFQGNFSDFEIQIYAVKIDYKI